MIEIDGSQGEGGGQVLRSALSLAILTGQPTHLTNIRRRRSKPGLMPQHLKAVEAAATISKGRVEGDYQGSQEIIFHPQEIRSGRYKFDIGTAGSTTLVFQTIFLPLSMASSASSVIITGGTHVPWSPCYHYLDLHWLPAVREIGYDARLSLDLAGFYPQGGGRIDATIRPAGPLHEMNITERGPLRRVTGLTAAANLPVSIADRQRRQALKRLTGLVPGLPHPGPKIATEKMPSKFKGTLLLLLAEFEHSRACYYGLGALGKPAERVADEAVDGLDAMLSTAGAIDPYLADQLLLPLAFAGGQSSLSTCHVSQHLVTNAAIIRAFGAAEITIQGEIGQPGLVHITPL